MCFVVVVKDQPFWFKMNCTCIEYRFLHRELSAKKSDEQDNNCLHHDKAKRNRPVDADALS